MARRRRGPTVQVGRQGPGLVGTMARTAVIAGTATATVAATSAVISKATGGGQQQAAVSTDVAQQEQIAQLETQQAQLAAQQQALVAQQAAAPAAPVPGSLDDIAQQIQKLQVMKEQGLITEEEFNAKKQQILGI